MATTSIRSKATTLMLAVAAGALAACAASSGPRQVSAENPNITYTYRTDQDLIQASQNAANYCAQYQSVQRTSHITNNPDGTNTVIFDCVKATTAATPVPTPAPVPVNPGMSYTYRTDQELLDASRNAEAYCMRTGMPMTSSIMTNPNGTKSVTFRCGPR